MKGGFQEQNADENGGWRLIDASKQVGLQVNIEKSKYMWEGRHQNAGQS
jgi:hypothetical protein